MRNRNSRRGSNILEFAVVAVVLIPLFFGAIALGLRLGTSVQATQVARDVGHMYSQGLDLTKPANRQLVLELAKNLAINSGSASDRGFIILSQIRMLTRADCTNGFCGNLGRYVVVDRVTIGNAALTPSRVATPRPGIVTSTGAIAAADYRNDASVIVASLQTLLDGAQVNLGTGEVLYVAETFTAMDSLQMFGSAGTGGAYARTIF